MMKAGMELRCRLAVMMTACLTMVLTASAQQRNAADAQRLADAFWPMKRGGVNVKPEMVYTEQDSLTQHPYFYIFNRGDNQGYIIISADERSKKIIGYSNTGCFDPDNVPSQMRAWLRVCREELKQLAVTPDSLLRMDLGQFVLSKGRSKGSQSFAASVSPLLGQINYSQSFPYNALCPQMAGVSCVTGCVATAAVQIMRYWQHPKQPTGKSHSYLLKGQSIGTTYNTVYDWCNMLSTYDSRTGNQQQQQAIARLMADAGIACDMDYSPQESGAYTNKMALGMVSLFGYDQGVMAYQRTDFTQADFVYYLKRELNAGRPVLVSGTGSGGGHCFVCDGYDAAGLFHINWGWNGMSNGYFELANLSPAALGTGGGTGGFNDDVVFYGGLQPPRQHSRAVYVLSFRQMEAPLSLNAGKKFQVGLEQLTNPSLYTYQGKVGIGLYQDGQLIDVLGTADMTLEPGYLCPELSVKGKFPSKLPDGEYQLVMVCKASNDDTWRACLNNTCNCIALHVSGKSVDATLDYATHYLDLPDNGFDQVASNTSADGTATPHTSSTGESSTPSQPGWATAALSLTQPLRLSAGNQLANGNQSVTAQLVADNDFTGKVGVFIYDATLQNCVATLQAGTISLPARQANNCTFSGVLTLPDGNYYACLFYVDANGQWGQVPQYEYSCAAFTLSDRGRLPAVVSSYANVMPGEGGGIDDPSPTADSGATAGIYSSGTFAGTGALDDHFYDDDEEDETENRKEDYSFDEFGEEVFAKSVSDREPFTCQLFRFADKNLFDAGGRMAYSLRMGETAKLNYELLNKHETAQTRIVTLSLYDKDDHWVTDLAERQVVVQPKSTLSDVFAVRLFDVVPGAYKLRLTQAAGTTAVSKPVAPAASSSALVQITR